MKSRGVGVNSLSCIAVVCQTIDPHIPKSRDRVHRIFTDQADIPRKQG